MHKNIGGRFVWIKMAMFRTIQTNDFLYISELINNSSIAIDTFILGIDPILFNENSPLDQWKNFHNDLKFLIYLFINI